MTAAARRARNAPTPGRDVRVLSASPAARKKRRWRARRRADLSLFRLYLPKGKIARAVAIRENFPDGKTPTSQEIERVVAEAVTWWAETWLRLKRPPGTNRK